MHPIIQDLKWRYATKKFDPNKKITESDLEVIKESLRLVPTSYGLQGMKILIIESKDIRDKLLDASYNQRQVVDASHLIVLCANTYLTEEDIDGYANRICTSRNLSINEISGYVDFMKRTVVPMPKDKQQVWLSKQVYIALGQLLETCAHLKIDSVPMEGFNSKEYDAILDLNKDRFNSVLVCPIGYRHPECTNQYKEKVRKSTEELFEIR